jgi:hypothetical protein
MRNYIAKRALWYSQLEMHSRYCLIEGSFICIERLNSLIGEIFAFRIGTYACYFNFLIEIAVSPIMLGVNVFPLGSLYFTNILRCEAIVPGEPSIVINDNYKLLILLAEGAHKALEKVSID